MLPADNGDQGVGATNRRIYINFSTSDQVSAIRFRSQGVAFEFDDIASSTARFNVGDGTSFVTMPAAVPEPATWAMMLLGFGMVGVGLRVRRTKLATQVVFG